jgi:hypothetical protein
MGMVEEVGQIGLVLVPRQEPGNARWRLRLPTSEEAEPPREVPKQSLGTRRTPTPILLPSSLFPPTNLYKTYLVIQDRMT